MGEDVEVAGEDVPAAVSDLTGGRHGRCPLKHRVVPRGRSVQVTDTNRPNRE